MNERQREIILERDGFRCVVCRGTCEFRGHGEEPCKLPSSKLAPVVYFRVEKGYHKLAQLNAEHVYGKKREMWNEVCAICPCCHRHKVQGGGVAFEREVAYLATVGPEPDEYRIAREQEADDRPKRRAALKAKRKAYRKATKARIPKPAKRSRRDGFGSQTTQKGKEPKMGRARLPSKVLEQLSRPNLNHFTTP